MTTLPAPTIAFSPIVIPGKRVALAPIDAPFLINIPANCQSVFLDFGYLSLQNVTLGPINTSSSMTIPSQICTPHLTVTLLPIFVLFSIKT